MPLRSVLGLIALTACLMGPAWAKRLDVTNPDTPRSLPAQGPVSVHWSDPAQFSELRNSGNRREAQRGDWVVQLATYLRSRAEPRLPPGERFDVEITDIQRAGNYEPWRGIQFDSVRFLREIYPPRIHLVFKRLDAGGSVTAQGERKLSDFAFLGSATAASDSDPLRFEKRLIDRWLVRELPARR
jgi:Protein of unknown function (DUF3016)